MNALSMKTTAMRLALAALVLGAPVFLLAACTDLGEETFSVVEPGDFFQTEAEVIAALAPVYAQLRQTLDAYHNLSQVSSDETIVPTRGTDWEDGGKWLAMHRQTWDANLADLNGAWIAAYTGIARANGLLQNLEAIDVPNKEGLSAELRALRAFYYYQLMDLFGGVPLVGDEEGEFIADPNDPPASNTREEVYTFIVSELEAVQGILPAEATQFGRMTSGAANAMLANLYLNAAVFTRSSDAISTTGYNSCAGAGTCDDAVAAATRVINGPYSLAETAEEWFGIFTPDNAANPEHIFVVQHLAEDGLGLNFMMRYLHYNQLVTPTPWNGFSTIAETYEAFDDADRRKDIFLEGPQINFDTGEPAEDRDGLPLVFTEDCGDITDASESACVRIAKYPPDPASEQQHANNDYAFFRLSEMVLIRAEANFALGNVGEAVSDINLLRERMYDEDEEDAPLLEDFLLDASELDEDRLLQERLFELTYEAKRRQDLVRFGRFDDPWSYKEASAGFRVLFPIPQVQLDANPNLRQNPGY